MAPVDNITASYRVTAAAVKFGRRAAAAACRETTAAPPRRSLRVICSRLTERHRHKARDVARLHPHQHVVLALRLGLDQRLAYIAGIGDRLAADVENDGAGLEALLGRRSVGIDAGDDDA